MYTRGKSDATPLYWRLYSKNFLWMRKGQQHFFHMLARPLQQSHNSNTWRICEIRFWALLPHSQKNSFRSPRCSIKSSDQHAGCGPYSDFNGALTESRPQLIENIITDQHLMLWSWIKRAYYKNSTGRMKWKQTHEGSSNCDLLVFV